MRERRHEVDFCVVGGGLAGLCAAVAAARKGLKTAIMQDRPMFGGNASSEIRMWICGAHGENNRETGILEEIILENFYRNPKLNYSIWDTVLYEKAMLEENLQIIMNCSCLDAEMDGDRIQSIKGWQTTTQTFHTVHARFFADCSGDSVLAPLTGAEFAMGREARSQYDEAIEPAEADAKTMGMSCLIQARETNQKQEFVPPDWAYRYETDEAFPEREHDLRNRENNFWWIELGGDRHSIYDTEELRDELLKIAYGVWDHVKNRGDHGADNWELEWIGMLPGKRESRRYIGDYVVNQNDVEAGGNFDDIIAYAGWTMDDHFPEGFGYKKGHPTIYHPAPSPWGIPFRSVYSRNIKNLFFAGRNISVSHAALSSSRVMATCAILGQAVGTAAALLCKEQKEIREMDIAKLQQELMTDDCYLPGKVRRQSALTLEGKCSAEIVRSGNDRDRNQCWYGKEGDVIEYTFAFPAELRRIRLVFDSHLERTIHNMPSGYPLDMKQGYLPEELIREYKLTITCADGRQKEIWNKENRQRLVWHETEPLKVVSVRLTPLKTWGAELFHVFGFELY